MFAAACLPANITEVLGGAPEAIVFTGEARIIFCAVWSQILYSIESVFLQLEHTRTVGPHDTLVLHDVKQLSFHQKVVIYALVAPVRV